MIMQAVIKDATVFQSVPQGSTLNAEIEFNCNEGEYEAVAEYAGSTYPAGTTEGPGAFVFSVNIPIPADETVGIKEMFFKILYGEQEMDIIGRHVFRVV